MGAWYSDLAGCVVPAESGPLKGLILSPVRLSVVRETAEISRERPFFPVRVTYD